VSHWAELDENNIVVRVLVGDNNDPNGDEGYQWLIDNLGGLWVKTSYNTKNGIYYSDLDNRIPSADQSKALRKNYASVGYTYNKDKDAFIPPKPYDSWLLDEDTCWWEAPVPHPTDDKMYTWDEDTTSWVEIKQ
jgi:hypothetical protein